jgi:hypothetical protein
VTAIERRAAQEAIQALKAVQSITNLGVNFRDYQPRIGDAKIKVDQYAARPGHDARVAAHLNLAMGYYALANEAWGVTIRGGSGSDWSERKEAVWRIMQSAECEPLRAFTEARTKSLWLWGRRPEYPGDDLEQKLFGPIVPTIWQCASLAIRDLDAILGPGP